ncbi:general secretion pathway protein GspK [Polyangium mundeleinium]|uniref:Type II secretion system protein GspK n=1 Tax=Polyangium mundeleinium TaxID=2995306 RepID=A0ABT5EG92_9BACT|nr:type II secretion system protein GspK [Polyangium mundeleinium]MDC0740238.1 type II secretion system protein GspK [Polyangium mundeleinium]
MKEPNREKEARKLRRRKRERRGVALLMVLGAITVLTVFLTELQQETTSELAAALADRDALKAEYLAKSAVNLSRLLIASEPTIRTSVPLPLPFKQLPVWEFTDIALGPFNDETGMATFGGMLGVDTTQGKGLGITGGSFTVKIVDEDSKINVNRAAPIPDIDLERLLVSHMQGPQYAPMFEGTDPDGQYSTMQTICGALTDWADQDENLSTCYVGSQAQGSTGAEDNYYQTIGLEYRRKNAAYDSLEELRLIRGVGDDFWATFVEPNPDDPKSRTLTVWGQKAVNVNTANPQTLLAAACSVCSGGAGATQSNATQGIPLCTDPTIQAQFLGLLGVLKTFPIPIFSKPADFPNLLKTGTVPGALGAMLGPMLTPLLAQAGLPCGLNAGASKQFTVTSKVFSIYAEGVVPGRKRTTRVRVHAVVDTRGVDPLTGGTATGSTSAQGLAQGAATGGTTSAGGTATGSTIDPLTALATNPLGKIVYYRID